MNDQTMAILFPFMCLLAVLGFIGTVLLALLIGHWHGSKNKAREMLSLNWLISKSVMPKEDDVVLVNLTRQTYHVTRGSQGPNRVIVESNNGTVTNLQGPSFRPGAPIEEMAAQENEDVRILSNLSLPSSKEGVH